MRARRYTVLVADRSTGLVRLRIGLGAPVTVAAMAVVVPVLIGLGASWHASARIDDLRLTENQLEIENGNYRVMTGDLATQIQSLEGLIDDLSERENIDAEQARAMQGLPAVIKARAAGGGESAATQLAAPKPSALTSPRATFAALHSLLSGLRDRLNSMNVEMARRKALAEATPSIWPARGWLTGTFGGRADPFTDEPGFHEGIDIASAKGDPVYATADGVVETAAYAGDYGNMIEIRHGFGLSTRYGHLSGYAVKAGDTVTRGQVIGYVGATGRATGAHVHYEILANGKPIDPLRLLTQPSVHAN